MNLSHNLPREELDANLMEALDVFRQAPPRDPQAAQAGRAAFLAQAQRMALSQRPAQRGLSSWLAAWSHAFRQMNWHSTYTASFALLWLIILLLGGGAAAVFAAQDSLPGEVFYGLKLSGEELHMALAADEPAQINLALEFTSRRVLEIETLAAQDQPLTSEMLLPLQSSLEQSLTLAAAVPGDAAMQQVLQRIEAHAHLQLQALERAGALVGGQAAPGLAQAHWMIQRQLQWVKQGQIAPRFFRQQSPTWFSQAPGQVWPAVLPGSATPQPAPSRTPLATHQTPSPQHTPGAGGGIQGPGVPGPHQPTGTAGQGGPNNDATGEPGAGPGGPSVSQTPGATPSRHGAPPEDTSGAGGGSGSGGSSESPAPGNGGGSGGSGGGRP